MSDDDPNARYKIIRVYEDTVNNKSPVTKRTGLTLAEARAHCADPKTRKPGVWRDEFTRQS